MTISDLLLRILHEYGVRQLFGIPGDAIRPALKCGRAKIRESFLEGNG